MCALTIEHSVDLVKILYWAVSNSSYTQATFVNIVLIAESFKTQCSRTRDQSNIQNFEVTRFNFWKKTKPGFIFGKTKTVEINEIINRLQMGMSTILHSFYSKMMD